MLSLEEGIKVVQFARQIIYDYIQHTSRSTVDLGLSFHEKQGVFVTLHTFPGHELRGCIGIPLPVMSLPEALTEAACGVTQDPRFPPLRGNELDAVVVEITVLTIPERITVKQPVEYSKHIVIGQDGLLIEQGFYKGLLLPQVPVEQEWDVEEFLSNACMKAGLTPDAWLDKATHVFKFQGQIFSETKPNGQVEEIQLDGSQH